MKKSTAAVAELPTLIDEDAMLSKFGTKERNVFEKLMQSSPGDPGDRWARWVRILMTLAPQSAKFMGARTMQFFIADGKYRKQVFALQGLEDGTIAVSARNILEGATKSGLLQPHGKGDELGVYRLPDSDETLAIQVMDGKTTNPDPAFKDMIGWNRKAIKITLPPEASKVQIKAAERLCVLASAGE